VVRAQCSVGGRLGDLGAEGVGGVDAEEADLDREEGELLQGQGDVRLLLVASISA
jgi:hypothetical protein